MRRLNSIGVTAGLMLAATAMAGDLSDAQVRELIVRDSVAAHSGSCPCPYNTDRAGRECGGRSAWSRRDASTPICYALEVTDSQIHEFRNLHRL